MINMVEATIGSFDLGLSRFGVSTDALEQHKPESRCIGRLAQPGMEMVLSTVLWLSFI
jgi:hypothetical protein